MEAERAFFKDLTNISIRATKYVHIKFGLFGSKVVFDFHDNTLLGLCVMNYTRIR